MSRRAKALVAAIDALIMGAFAFSETDGSVGIGAAELVLWGAVAAAAATAPQSTSSAATMPTLPSVSLNANAPMISASMAATRAFALRDTGAG